MSLHACIRICICVRACDYLGMLVHTPICVLSKKGGGACMRAYICAYTPVHLQVNTPHLSEDEVLAILQQLGQVQAVCCPCPPNNAVQLEKA